MTDNLYPEKFHGVVDIGVLPMLFRSVTMSYVNIESFVKITLVGDSIKTFSLQETGKIL